MKPIINKELIMDYLKELEKYYVVDYNDNYFDDFVENCITDLQSDNWNWEKGYETEIISNVILDNAGNYDVMWEKSGYGVEYRDMNSGIHNVVTFNTYKDANIFANSAKSYEDGKIDIDGINWELTLDNYEVDYRYDHIIEQNGIRYFIDPELNAVELINDMAYDI